MLPTNTFIGNIRRIETSQTSGGKEVTRFQIECSEKNAKGEWLNLYINGEVWEKTSQFLTSHFKDGDAIVVTSKIYTNIYKDKNDKTVYETKLLYPEIYFVTKDRESKDQPTSRHQENGKPEIVHETAPREVAQSSIPEIDLDEENIPFNEVNSTSTQSYK